MTVLQILRRRAIVFGAIGLACMAYALLFFSLFMPGSSASPSLADYRGTWLNPPQPLVAFRLTDQDDKPFGLAELRGRPTLLFFGYSSCPDICPTTLADFVQVRRALGADADKVAFVFISVDGGHDTPPLIKRYLTSFDSSFIGLTGDDSTVLPVARQFGVFVQRQKTSSQAGYSIDHTAATFLIDAGGKLRAMYSYGVKPAILTQDVQKLLMGRVP